MKTSMNAEPALVDRTSRSLKLRRNCTAGETSEPKVAVAIIHFVGKMGGVVVFVVTLVVVTGGPVVVVVVVMATMSVTATVAVSPPPVPLTVMMVVLAGAVPETARENTELVLPPAGGVTGLGVNPPVTPDGNVGTARVTAELKPPIDCTVTMAVPTPPGLIVRLLGVTVRVNEGTAVVVVVVVVVVGVTVNVALADFPVLPTRRIV